ncbi:MAG: hypothetical protein JWP52_1502, partial [Rhizobacter sp.]|nr:hypothetical protein [Rhizobacter sp.]
MAPIVAAFNNLVGELVRIERIKMLHYSDLG